MLKNNQHYSGELVGALAQFKRDLVVLDETPVEVRLLATHIHRRLFTTDLTIKHLKKQLGLIDPLLETRFRRHYGHTPKRYVAFLRVEAAQVLMATTLSLPDISLHVGYENYRTFARVFKRAKGIPPSLFRKQIQ